MNLDYPKNLRFVCNRCGVCCGDTLQKTRHVLLLKADAERVAKVTGQAVASFAQETEDKSPYVYEMKKKPDGKCVFLKNNQCIIYAQRPLICRFYPFELKTAENGVHTFTVTVECPGVLSLDTTKGGNVLDECYFKRLLRLARGELGFDGEF